MSKKNKKQKISKAVYRQIEMESWDKLLAIFAKYESRPGELHQIACPLLEAVKGGAR